MSNFKKVFLGNSPQLDAFGRLRVSSPQTLFDGSHEYVIGPECWEQQVNGAGTISFNANGAKAVLANGGGTIGDYAKLQTREYWRYQPGKSQFVLCTLVAGTPTANVEKIIGYGDERNGVFLVQDGTNGWMVRIRSYVTGSAVDTDIAQADWSEDKLNGLTPSGIDIDPTLIQIFWLDLEWLAAGTVRFGFVIDGEFVVAHKQNHANQIDTVYMSTANLPFHAQILNTGAASADSFDQICVSVMSEGGLDLGRLRPYGWRRAAAVSAGTGGAFGIGLRLAATYGGVPNHSIAFPTGIAVTNTGNAGVAWELWGGYDFSITPAPSAWAAVGNTSKCEYIVGSPGSWANGRILDFGFVTASGVQKGEVTQNIRARVPLTNSIDHSTPTEVALILTSLTGTQSCYCGILWDEFG